MHLSNVISYASRSLTQSETKYPVHKLEFLCLKWAITEQFHEYLYDNMYIRVNNPLLNKNIGKYHLPHIWDEVLVNNTELKLK